MEPDLTQLQLMNHLDGKDVPPPEPHKAKSKKIPTNFGPDPQRLVCPQCHSHIVSKVDMNATTKTHLFALFICIIFFPYFWLPYCCDSCQAINHYCPECNAFLGSCDY